MTFVTRLSRGNLLYLYYEVTRKYRTGGHVARSLAPHTKERQGFASQSRVGNVKQYPCCRVIVMDVSGRRITMDSAAVDNRLCRFDSCRHPLTQPKIRRGWWLSSHLPRHKPLAIGAFRLTCEAGPVVPSEAGPRSGTDGPHIRRDPLCHTI